MAERVAETSHSRWSLTRLRTPRLADVIPSAATVQQLPPAPTTDIPPQQRPTYREEVFAIKTPIPEYFRPSPFYERQMHFWRRIYTELRSNQVIFYHREYPELPPYSVIDLPSLTAADYRKARGRSQTLRRIERGKHQAATDHERERVRSTLLGLADKVQNPTARFTPWERELIDSFRTLDGSLSANFKAATGKTRFGRQSYIRAQRGVANWVEDALARANGWIEPMSRVLTKNDLPPQLLAIPLIEGLFSESARSSSSAVGPWQFLSKTGRIFGLKIVRGYDERRDPVLATEAAAKYISSAYRELQTTCRSIGQEATDRQLWPLTITSFNRGIAGMKSVIRETRSCDLETIIQREGQRKFDVAVKSYWPAFMVAAEIFNDPTKYFPEPAKKNKPVVGQFYRLTKQTALTTLIAASGLTREEFLRINPAILAGVKSAPAGARIRLPEAPAAPLAQRLALEPANPF